MQQKVVRPRLSVTEASSFLFPDTFFREMFGRMTKSKSRSQTWALGSSSGVGQASRLSLLSLKPLTKG
jgi:hypothetical protein